MKPRINWFSPLPPARTEIANCTVRLLSSLAAKTEVNVWSEQATWSSLPHTPVPIHSSDASALNWPDLNHSDTTIYQIGNDKRFHSNALAASHKHPGVVILHDTNLHELCLGFLSDYPGRDSRYISLLRRYYGSSGESAGRDYLNGTLTLDKLVDAFPMTQWFTENSIGVIVHNPTISLSSISSGRPAAYLPLPYKSESDLIPCPKRIPQPKPTKLNMVVFGFLNSPNRRLLPLLEALGSYPQKDRCKLLIIGDVADRTPIDTRIRQLNLGHQVEITGFVSDERLDTLLKQADLAINLRYPTRGEASASQLRVWEYALPSAVTNDGWYSSLPENTVYFIDPAREQEDLHALWDSWFIDPLPFVERGCNGRAQLKSLHTNERYVDGIVKMIALVNAWEGHYHLRELAQMAVGHICSLHTSKPVQKSLIDRIASDLADWIPASVE